MQTKLGAIKAGDTIREKYGLDYWQRIGRLGGSAGTTGGFHYSKVSGQNWHITAARKGGLKRVWTDEQKAQAQITRKRTMARKQLFDLNYQMINDDNAPLFEKVPKLSERIKRWLSSTK